MKITLAITAFASLLTTASAFAFPPTATTSPGYDRALAESRRARQVEPPVFVPAPQDAVPQVHRRHLKRH